MKTLTLVAPAKINLYLEILGDRPDGFHELAMVMQSIALGDRLHLRPRSGHGFQLSCDRADLEVDERNLILKAAQRLQRSFPQLGGVEFFLEKRIPIGAGLAGGSTDGAAALVGLDLFSHLGLTQPELEAIAAELGSDMPFCIAGATQLCTGRGEQLTPLPPLPELPIVLAKFESLSVSTPWAYGRYREQFGDRYLQTESARRERLQALHAGPLLQAMSAGDPVAIAQHLRNDLEAVVLPEYPQVAQLRAVLGDCAGILAAQMSGSGPSVFGIAESPAAAQAAVEQVREAIADPDLKLWATTTVSHGIQTEV
ncbi:4-(cytidine 5'-diphospho)-2-C-methyl-D-erythritol kinase [Synechococcus elongatus IITB4]|uniref:4-(cytidine 5'-diphospho)-2-C-methyl-D-erythritol kinase n=1 Tax=Synechococcus elongatus TaxID=32046 RepID=UPI0030CA6628